MRKNNILDALFPRTRQNILATLLLSPERRWYLSDLAQHLQVPPSSLQRELASLAQSGILCREADGNRVYYQASPAHPLLPELQRLFAKTVGLADKVREALEPFEDDIDLAFIFGSVARGERTAHSDVDVLLVGSVGMADLALPLRELEQALQIPVNVTHFTQAEFRDKWARNNHFLRTVLRGQKIILKGSEHELADTVGEPKDQGALHEQAELDDLSDVVDRDLADAAIPALSADRRFATAYNAALQTATMAVACAGYRTSGMGHHQTTFEVAELVLGTGSAPLTAYFDTCRRKRNTVDYDRAHVATETEASEVVKRAKDFLTLVEAWIAQNYSSFRKT